MNNYIDKDGFFHDSPCINGEPSSNNAFIYTAYAHKLGFRHEYNVHIAEMCDYLKVRRKGLYNPPISRDEILGLAYLGHLNEEFLKGWNFCPSNRKLPRLNPFKLVKQLLECRGKHRNYFWTNNLDQVYHVAFSVPLQDRAFIMRCWEQDGGILAFKYNFYRLIEYFDKKSKKRNGIRFLKYGTGRKEMLEEFPEDHPFRY